MSAADDLAKIQAWHESWADTNVEHLDVAALWDQLFQLLHPRPALIVQADGNVLTGPWPHRDALGRVVCPDCDGLGEVAGGICAWCEGEGNLPATDPILTEEAPKAPLPGRWHE